jgi:hypothetical protein
MGQHITAISEFAFVDPGVADLGALLQGLRPEIEAVVLGAERSALAQIADRLAGLRGLRAIHIIAHGAPGEIGFTAGRLSLATIPGCARDLARIGDTLGADGELLLWSCETGRGAEGERFIAALEKATRASVAASTGIVGAAAKGACWKLDAYGGLDSLPVPLTAAGVEAYPGVLAAKTWANPGTSSNWNNASNWSPSGVPASGDTVTIGGVGNVGAYSVTLDIAASVSTLTISATKGATLIVGANTLTVGSTSGTAITLSHSGDNITMTGGTITDAGGISLAGTISGRGTLNVSGSISGAGTLHASGGTLDVSGTIASGIVFSIDSSSSSVLKIEGTATSAAAISITSSNQTLEIGASGALTIVGQQTVSGGTIRLDGGSLTDSSGLVVGTSGTLTGFGTVNPAISGPSSGTGTITASGGTLELKSTLTLGTGALALTVGGGASDRLLLDAASTATSLGFSGSTGTLELNTSGTLTLSTGLLVGANTVRLDGSGSHLTDNAGISVSTGTLTGQGTVTGAITATGAAHITANGGTLTIANGITDSGQLTLTVTGSSDRLVLDGTSAANAVSFSGNSGTLELAAGLTLGTALSVGSGTVQLDSGGSLTDGSGILLSTGTLTGQGAVTGAITASGAAHITANGGTLTIANGITDSGQLTLTVTGNSDRLVLDGTSAANAVSFSGTSGTLELAAGLTVGTLLSVGSGTVQLDSGGSLTDASGISLSTGTLTGQGTVTGAITASNAAHITANGGTLTIANGITDTNNQLTLTVTGNSDRLVLDGTSAAHAVSFSGNSGTLELAAGLTVGTALSVGSGTLQLDSGGSLTDNTGISLSGGMISGAGSLASSTNVTGWGTLGLNFGAGAGNLITASGGTLDLTGTVSAGPTLAIDDNAVLRIDGTVTTGSITLDTANQALEIGVSDTSLTLTTREHVTAGAIQLGGGTLTDSAGFQLDGGTVSRTGTITGGTIDGTGVVEALGGQLDLGQATIGGDATGLEIANDGQSTLVVDHAASGAVASFLGGSGTLRILHVGDFFATISGLQVGNSGTTPTNEVDLADVGTITRSVISGATVTFYNGSNVVAALHLASAPGAGVHADWIPDSGTGSDIFLSTVACFSAGTRILTENGEAPVETLKIGDRVMPVRRGQADPLDRTARLWRQLYRRQAQCAADPRRRRCAARRGAGPGSVGFARPRVVYRRRARAMRAPDQRRDDRAGGGGRPRRVFPRRARRARCDLRGGRARRDLCRMRQPHDVRQRR